MSVRGRVDFALVKEGSVVVVGDGGGHRQVKNESSIHLITIQKYEPRERQRTTPATPLKKEREDAGG